MQTPGHPYAATDDGRTFGRDLLHLLGWPLLLVAAGLYWLAPWAPAVYHVKQPEEIFAVVSGTWDWADADSTCAANPHTISFSDDHRLMYLVHRRPWSDTTGAERRVTVYDVREETDSRIRGAIQGEPRVTETGEPVVWDLLLTSRDSYVWRRTDWSFYAHTNPVGRCPPGTDSLVPPR